MSWVEELSSKPIKEVALKLGLRPDRHGRHWGPCPACGEERRSRTDDRLGPVWIGVDKNRWGCSRCSAHGSQLDLVAMVATGRPVPQRGDRHAWGDVREAAVAAGLVGNRARDWEPIGLPMPSTPVAPPPPRRPDNVEEVWNACIPARDCSDTSEWLRRRSETDRWGKFARQALLESDDLRAFPEDTRWMPDWCRWWNRGWLAVLPVWDSRGLLAGLRGRWVHDCPPPGGIKTAPMRGFDNVGAVLADWRARQLLVSPASAIQNGIPPVVVMEGEPDYLGMVGEIRAGDVEPPCVFGLYNGAWTDDFGARLPWGTRVEIRTHHDPAGDGYAAKVTRSAGGCVVTRRAS